jgi:hypothetical protein
VADDDALQHRYTIKMLRPTPTDGPIELVARVTHMSDERATVEASCAPAARSARRQSAFSSL